MYRPHRRRCAASRIPIPRETSLAASRENASLAEIRRRLNLDRSEGMLNRLAPFAHLFRMFVEPALHRLENVLMLPSGDPSFLASGAAVLDAAALAGFGRVAAQDQSIFRGGEGVGEPFTGRTDVNVILSYITEVLLAEAPFRLCVRGHWLW